MFQKLMYVSKYGVVLLIFYCRLAMLPKPENVPKVSLGVEI